MSVRTLKIASCVGARPQFIKVMPVRHALATRGIKDVLVHTGQHYDPNMSGIFFDELGIAAPEHNLGIHGGSHATMTGRMLIALEAVFEQEQPDIVLTYGDTNSTLAGALAATKLNIPVAHVEAGLRSFDRSMPEETNRVLTDHMSTVLFCPTSTAVANLKNEGITDGVEFVGDVMYDATLAITERALQMSSIVKRLALTDDGFALATVHRAANTDDRARLAAIFDYLRDEAAQHPIVLPLHPRTRVAAQRWSISLDGLRVIEPVGYLDMARLLAGCCGVYTDSGGLQKEAYFHRKPCVTLRDETEWTETVECGWNRLWQGPDYLPKRVIKEYGDGHAAEKIVDRLHFIGTN